MEIQLNQIVPIPLKDMKLSDSEIWNQKFSFQSSNYYQIVAPSGTGKTTLLHILYGERKDFSGDISYRLKNDALSDLDLLRQSHISMVFQDLMLFEELTALENVLIKNQILNYRSDEWIQQAFDQLGILNKKNSLVGTMSRGERQRVAIIRALCMPFQFLLLDEPFSHLDELNEQKAAALINDAVEELNAGIILVNVQPDNYFKYSHQLKL